MVTLSPSNRHHVNTQESHASSSTHSKNVHINESNNQTFGFSPILQPTAICDLSLVPTRSILKRISAYDDPDNNHPSLLPLDRQSREMTPEPENALQQPTYLLSPVKTLVESVSASQMSKPFASSNFHDLIEAYSLLKLRIHGKDLSSESTDVTPASQQTTVGSPSTPHCPAFGPIKDNIDDIVVALRRDISRALEDPVVLAAQSPSASDAPPFSSEPSDPESGQRKGMNEHQVKLARDLCIVSQSALRLLSTLFSLPSFVQYENGILSVSQCNTLLDAVLDITTAETLPTPNAYKTWALATTILGSNDLPEPVIKPASSRIIRTFRSAMRGKLDKKGKKRAIGEALRGVQSYTVEWPHLFIAGFRSFLRPILKFVVGNDAAIRSPASSALYALAYGAMVYPDVARERFANVVERFMDAQTTRDGGKPAFLESFARSFKKMNDIVYPKKAEETGQAATTPEEQGRVQQAAMRGLTVLSSLILLSGPALFSKQSLLLEPFMEALEILTSNKLVYVRTAASYGWRALAWVAVTSLGEKVFLTDEEQSFWTDLLSFVDKKIGVGIICGLLCDQDNAVNRKTRRELVIITLKEMARHQGTAAEAGEILGRLLAGPKGAPSSENRWDISNLVPTVLLDGALVKQDAEGIHGVIREQQQQEAGWIHCIPPWTREECEDAKDDFAEIWSNAVKSGGIKKSAISSACLANFGALERASGDLAAVFKDYGELLAVLSTRMAPDAPTFAATQTAGAAEICSLSAWSDEGEEEVPVELPGPDLVAELLRLRNLLNLSPVRRSQKRGREDETEQDRPVKRRRLNESPRR